MTDTNEVGSPLTDYLKTVIKDIRNSLSPKEEGGGVVNVEISTILEKKKGIGIMIQVLNAGANVKDVEVHKLGVPIKILNEVEIAKKKIELTKLFNSPDYKTKIKEGGDSLR